MIDLPIRICFTTRAPFVSGAEVALGRLAKGLVEAGQEPVIVCGQGGDASEMFASLGLETCVIPLHHSDRLHPFRFLSSVRKLEKFLRERAIDIVHANDVPSYQSVSLAAKRLRIPRVCHARFLVEDAGAMWFFKYGIERVVAISQYMAGHLQETAPDVFSGKVSVSLDGMVVTEGIGEEAKLSARKKLGVPEGVFVFLFAGQFCHIKGVKDLVEAVAGLATGVRERCRFYLIGDDLQTGGQYRKVMMELADTLVPQGISFPGFRRDIPDWLRASDCAIVPSHVEPLGLAVMEALAAGLPVVATGVGGIPEMIQDGVTGILVAPEAPAELAAAMTYVVSNQEKVREVGLRAHAYARAHFTIERHVREIVSIYEELLTMWPKRTGEAR